MIADQGGQKNHNGKTTTIFFTMFSTSEKVGDGPSSLYTGPAWSEGPKKFGWMNESTWHPTWHKVIMLHGLSDVCIRALRKNDGSNAKPETMTSNEVAVES